MTHLSLYIAMILLPLSGLLGSMYSKYPIQYFGIPLPRLLEQNDALKEIFKEAHELCATILMALLVLHIIGALKHAIVDKNKNHHRMLFK
jgi:cytochrome b561